MKGREALFSVGATSRATFSHAIPRKIFLAGDGNGG
jgi:hypothetical protein